MSSKRTRNNTHIVTTTLPDEARAIGGLHIDYPNQRIVAKDSTVFPLKYESVVSMSYERQNKTPKAIYEIYETHNVKLWIDSHDYLRSFDFVCAVDTNIKSSINYTGIIILKIIKNECFDFHAECNRHLSRLDKEKLGWLFAIDRLTKLEISGKILIITDAHKGDTLKKIQQRMSPLCGTIFLPPNTSIMYASSDKKNDSLYNKFIYGADKYANNAYKGFGTDDTSDLEEVFSYDELFDYLRNIP